jgi:hypothetical protein
MNLMGVMTMRIYAVKSDLELNDIKDTLLQFYVHYKNNGNSFNFFAAKKDANKTRFGTHIKQAKNPLEVLKAIHNSLIIEDKKFQLELMRLICKKDYLLLPEQHVYERTREYIVYNIRPKPGSTHDDSDSISGAIAASDARKNEEFANIIAAVPYASFKQYCDSRLKYNDVYREFFKRAQIDIFKLVVQSNIQKLNDAISNGISVFQAYHQANKGNNLRDSLPTPLIAEILQLANMPCYSQGLKAS